jgi:hypothetical protein
VVGARREREKKRSGNVGPIPSPPGWGRGSGRGGGQRVQDPREHAIEVFCDLAIPETQDPYSEPLKGFGPNAIVRELAGSGMLAAV